MKLMHFQKSLFNNSYLQNKKIKVPQLLLILFQVLRPKNYNNNEVKDLYEIIFNQN
jgi:hypothetical protein